MRTWMMAMVVAIPGIALAQAPSTGEVKERAAAGANAAREKAPEGAAPAARAGKDKALEGTSLSKQVNQKAAQAQDKAGEATEKAGQARDKAAEATDKAADAKEKAATATEKAGEAKEKAADAKAAAVANPLDINSASEDDLKSLPGIGEARAKKIIESRPFDRKDQLISKGIVPKSVYNKIKTLIVAKQQ